MPQDKKLTVLIPTSPIPSHPDTAILDETIANIRKYTDAVIIIMADGVHESLAHRTKDYEAYLTRLEENVIIGKYGECNIVEFDSHTHQANNANFIRKFHQCFDRTS